MYYVQYFGLAYKRIGVVFFLVLCLVVLVTLVLKIYKVKSLFYVLRINALAVYITLVGICIFNWDVIIAKYNFGHYQTAFIHLPYMSSLSDKVLPYLQVSEAMIEEIEDKQIASGNKKRCPECLELLKVDASVCKHCGHTFT